MTEEKEKKQGDPCRVEGCAVQTSQGQTSQPVGFVADGRNSAQSGEESTEPSSDPGSTDLRRIYIPR